MTIGGASTRGALSRVYRGESNIDFVGRRKLWFAISGLVILVSLVSLLTKGLNYGIEFKGGVEIQASIPATGPLAGADESTIIRHVNKALAPFGATSAQVQVATNGANRNVVVQTKAVSNPGEQQKVVAAVAHAVGAPVNRASNQRISSSWGGEITAKAVRALVIFLLVITIFISWRFEWKMAVAAFVALIHDLLITAGVYSLVGFEVTPSTVIAILTILGYSLYDTVVVFDKVEENTSMLATTGKMTYQDSANLAMNQVFMRSLNTSLATLLPVAALLFVGAGLLGAATLEDLALALLVGILSGTYSSIFVATPVLSMLKEREPRYRSVRDKVLRESKRQAAARPAGPRRLTAVPDDNGAGGDEDSERVPAGVGSGSASSASRRPQPTRARVGSKKAKRRKRR